MNDGILTYEKADEITYLEMVIMGKIFTPIYKNNFCKTKIKWFLLETIRMHPPIPVIVKLCTEETELPLTETKNVKIHKGTVL